MHNTSNIKKKSPLDLFMLSVVLVQVGTIIRLQLDSQLFGNIFRIIGFMLLVYSLITQMYSKNKPKLNGMMIFLLLWNTINILYTAITTRINPTRALGEESYLLAYLLPYLLIYDVRNFNLNKLFKYCLLFALFALIIIALNYEYIINANNALYIINSIEQAHINAGFAQIPIMWSIPAAILFMNPTFVRKRDIRISLFVYILAIAFSMTFGRRSTSAYGLIFIFLGVYQYFNNPEIPLRKKVLFFIVISGFIIVASYIIVSHFSYLMIRALEDTRTAVHDSYYDDMNTIDYIFGRGLNGTYYDPMSIFDSINNMRPDIETGYLNIILHSGLLFLVPYLVICLYSSYKGAFKSKNTFTKSFALYILINTLMLIVGSYPAYNLRFLIMWIGILICNNDGIRAMSNSEIMSFYQIRKK